MSDLKAYQLKDIIRQYLEKTPETTLKYKSKARPELLKIIDDLGINVTEYDYLKPTPKMPASVLKKYLTQPYTETQQKEFIEEPQEFALQARGEYVNKEGRREKLSLQEHQIKFIKQFIYSNLQGSIVFHGVGSGKTLTAVVASYWYLQVYPNNKVIVISPSALLYNFIEGMKQYGLQIEDNRYTFTTYDKYTRKPQIAKDALLIVDEAHNLRTEIKLSQGIDPVTKTPLPKQATSNKRAYSILQNGAMYAHKILLLTGTAFVNSIYDVENLLAMIDQREPISTTTFQTVLSSVTNIETYFSYKISYYPSPKSEFFPEMRETLVPLFLSDESKADYNERTKVNKSFYISERTASNLIPDRDGVSYKAKWIINKVKSSPQKFIIYTGQYANGIILLEQSLKAHNIKYVRITGKENASNKEQSKKLYNGYDYGNPDFFNPDTITPEFKKYINSDYRVLLISRAGAEGVDTINTQNLIIMDHQWNDALSQQIIARAIRYKSHFGLPKEDRYVNVYRLFVCLEDDRELFNRVASGNINYIKLNRELKESIRQQLAEKNKLDGDKDDNPSIITRMSIDLRLFILCKSKQANIDNFIKYLGNSVKVFEQYEPALLKLVAAEESKLKRQLSDEEQSKIYVSLLKDEKVKLAQRYYGKQERSGADVQKQLQQYFTNPALAAHIINLVNFYAPRHTNTSIEILEPTAGDGKLIGPIIDEAKGLDYNIDMVEIDPNNRRHLQYLADAAPNIVRLLPHPNFLTFATSKRYDYIFMNPPFHIQKEYNPTILNDIYDIDFVKRAYALLKVGGTLVAIVGAQFWKRFKRFEDWLEGVGFDSEELKKQQFDKVKVDITIIKIVKEDDSQDNEILDLEFYKKHDSADGKKIMDATMSLSELPNKPSVTDKPLIDSPPAVDKPTAPNKPQTVDKPQPNKPQAVDKPPPNKPPVMTKQTENIGGLKLKKYSWN